MFWHNAGIQPMKIDSGTVEQNRIAADSTSASTRDAGPEVSGIGPLVCLVLLGFLFAVFKVVGISLRINVLRLFGLYLSIGVQSIAYAVLLVAIQFPREKFIPALMRLMKRPELIVMTLAIAFLAFRLFPAAFAFPLVITVLALTQLRWISIGRTLLPGLYLFAGLFTAFGYNVVAVTVRFKPDYDALLRRADAFFLLGHSVSELSHKFAAAVPGFVSSALFIWYVLMFVQVGAALMFCSTLVSRDYALKFVSTILIAYAITVSVFFVFPTHSPYFSCVDHFGSQLPHPVLEIQKQFRNDAIARWEGGRTPLGPEYYISFPCMHIAQPLIAMWFLRRWRRIVRFLTFVNIILAFSIVILEWHYFVDLLGGVAVAAVSIWVISRRTPDLQMRVAQ